MSLSGWIYAAKSSDMKEFRYKIGMTKREPELRVKELSISHEDMFIVYKKQVKNRFKAEKKVFDLLKEYIVEEGKEIVDVYDVDMLKTTFDYVSEMQNKI